MEPSDDAEVIVDHSEANSREVERTMPSDSFDATSADFEAEGDPDGCA